MVQEHFIVFTFERSISNEEDRFFWVIPVKEINEKSQSYPFYDLFLSKDAYKSCKEGKSVSFFLNDSSVLDESDKFVENHINETKNLQNIIFENRTHLISVRKKSNAGFREKLKVYFTPIIGTLCKCELAQADYDRLGFKEEVYFPISKISFDPSFSINYSQSEFMLINSLKLNRYSTIFGR